MQKVDLLELAKNVSKKYDEATALENNKESWIHHVENRLTLRLLGKICGMPISERDADVYREIAIICLGNKTIH